MGKFKMIFSMHKATILSHLLTILILSLGFFSAAQARNECDSQDRLKSHAGHYAKKIFWENLPKLKSWAETMKRFNTYDSSAINIFTDGMLASIDGWHEAGAPNCVQFRNNELWVRNPYDPKTEWLGPFIRVGSADPAYSENRYYFDKIFGDGCYTSDKQERWCFQSGTVFIDSKRHDAELALDTSEMPDYGTPVSIDKKDGFWIFVPIAGGWNVFQDTFVSAEDHKDIDPKKSVPWRVLKGLPK
jgi:hypothetical protein